MEHQEPTGLPVAGNLKVPAAVDVEYDTQPRDATYALSQERVAFFKSQTGIHDDQGLRAHILEIQERAYQVFPYWCIKRFMFLLLGIEKHPEYERMLELGRVRQDGILLDIGCCFGVDARKVVADGFPLRNVVTTDLEKEFYDLGHALFNTTPETYPISFVAGDALDPGTLQIVPPFDEHPLTEKPDLSTLTSLNPLAGRCAVIYASNFFHLFLEENQLHLAKALAGLLSPEPGSMICGEQPGTWQKQTAQVERSGKLSDVFLHSPESWNAMWDGEIFSRGKVGVNVKLELVVNVAGVRYDRLRWSVVRL